MLKHTFFDFDWDPNKARTNLRKHGVSFRLATTVFRDPLALTILDDEHSEKEERWVTLGAAENGQYLVVIHTSQWLTSDQIKLRIISARIADRREVRDYQNAPR